MTKYKNNNRMNRRIEYSPPSTTVVPTPAISPFTQEPVDYEDNRVAETIWTTTWSNFQIIEHFPEQEDKAVVLEGLGILGGLAKSHDTGNKRTVRQKQPHSKRSNKITVQPKPDMNLESRRD
jgi:hypothetical protein